MDVDENEWTAKKWVGPVKLDDLLGEIL
jgi:hypothetical protein